MFVSILSNISIRNGTAPDTIAPRLDWRERSEILVDDEPDLFAAFPFNLFDDRVEIFEE